MFIQNLILHTNTYECICSSFNAHINHSIEDWHYGWLSVRSFSYSYSTIFSNWQVATLAVLIEVFTFEIIFIPLSLCDQQNKFFFLGYTRTLVIIRGKNFSHFFFFCRWLLLLLNFCYSHLLNGQISFISFFPCWVRLRFDNSKWEQNIELNVIKCIYAFHKWRIATNGYYSFIIIVIIKNRELFL